MCCRSTVAFAREVVEQKAMDDAIDKIEDIFGADKSHYIAGTSTLSQGVSCVVL